MTNTKAIKILIVLLVIAVMLTLLQSTPKATDVREDTHTENTEPYYKDVPEINTNEVAETELSDEIFEEMQIWSKLIYALCNEESEKTQTAIMATLLNIQESADFPDTVYGVIETSDILTEIWETEAANLNFEDLPNDTLGVVRDVYNGNDPTEWLLEEEATKLGLDPIEYAYGGALYFHKIADCDQQMLENIKVKVIIGNYIFYKM